MATIGNVAAFILAVSLLVCGFCWNSEYMLLAAAIGCAIGLFGGLGATFAPDYGGTYIDLRTGRKTQPMTEAFFKHIHRFGIAGIPIAIVKFVGLILAWGFIGMLCFGAYAVVRLIIAGVLALGVFEAGEPGDALRRDPNNSSQVAPNDFEELEPPEVAPSESLNRNLEESSESSPKRSSEIDAEDLRIEKPS